MDLYTLEKYGQNYLLSSQKAIQLFSNNLNIALARNLELATIKT
jgi:hypothetical protein